MSDLISALKKRIEFDAWLIECDKGNRLIKLLGAEQENARLQPVLLALCECVEALEVALAFCTLEATWRPKLEEPLARLKEVVEAE